MSTASPLLSRLIAQLHGVCQYEPGKDCSCSVMRHALQVVISVDRVWTFNTLLKSAVRVVKTSTAALTYAHVQVADGREPRNL